MHIKMQLVMCDDNGQETTVTDIVTLKKEATRLEHLGLTLKEESMQNLGIRPLLPRV